MDSTFQIEDMRSSESRSGCLRGCLMGCGVLAILAFLALVVAGFFVYRVVDQAIIRDPEQANQVLQEVLQCQVPEGYRTEQAVKVPVLDMRMVMIQPVGGFRPQEDTMFIVVAAQNFKPEQLEQQFRMQAAQQGAKFPAGKAKETSIVKVQVGDRTREATKIQSRDEKQSFVQYLVPIKPGVLCTAHGPQDGFDQAAFESFLKSIRGLPPAPDEDTPPETEETKPEEPKSI